MQLFLSTSDQRSGGPLVARVRPERSCVEPLPGGLSLDKLRSSPPP